MISNRRGWTEREDTREKRDEENIFQWEREKMNSSITSIFVKSIIKIPKHVAWIRYSVVDGTKILELVFKKQVIGWRVNLTGLGLGLVDGYTLPKALRYTSSIDSNTATYSNINLIQYVSFARSDYEECRLLGYKTQFVPHRRHITSPLERPAG
jgi:hypothetical protein